MRFEEALYNFRSEIQKEYGTGHDLLKIAVSYELFDVIYSEFHTGSAKYCYFSTIAQGSDFKIFDIEIVARKKDTF